MDKKIVAYLRVSTQAQVTDGVSLDRQEAEIRQYCAANALGEPLVLADRGLSGYRESRPAFQKMLAMCKTGEIEAVIVWDLARLSRSLRTTILFFEDVVAKYGFRFIALKNSVDTSTPWGKAWLAILSTINQLYRDEVSFRTRASLDYKRRNREKLGGTVPYGFDVDGDGNLHPNATEQGIIDLMFEMQRTGLSFQAIAYALDDRAIPTKTGKRHWAANTIRAILSRRHSQSSSPFSSSPSSSPFPSSPSSKASPPPDIPTPSDPPKPIAESS